MDEALGFASVDVSGRPYLVFDAAFPQPAANSFDFCMVQEFFRAFAFHAGITLHIKALYGNNTHHIAEALFKACAHAMRLAVQKDGRAPLSTKGAFD